MRQNRLRIDLNSEEAVQDMFKYVTTRLSRSFSACGGSVVFKVRHIKRYGQLIGVSLPIIPCSWQIVLPRIWEAKVTNHVIQFSNSALKVENAVNGN